MVALRDRTDRVHRLRHIGPFTKKRSGNPYISVVTDRFSTFRKVMPITKLSTTTVAIIFLEHWVRNFRILTKLLTKNGLQFTFKYFSCYMHTNWHKGDKHH